MNKINAHLRYCFKVFQLLPVLSFTTDYFKFRSLKLMIHDISNMPDTLFHQAKSIEKNIEKRYILTLSIEKSLLIDLLTRNNVIYRHSLILKNKKVYKIMKVSFFNIIQKDRLSKKTSLQSVRFHKNNTCILHCHVRKSNNTEQIFT